jgi:formate--tetrahydrofolate ligase
MDHCKSKRVRCALSDVFSKGGAGGEALAEQVLEVLDNERPNFRFLYDTALPLKDKVKIIATEMYGASDVQYESGAEKAIQLIESSGMNRLPVCMAKTQLSLSDNPKLKGAPIGWELNVREVFVSAGAGFIVVVCGPVMLMPGLSSDPAALSIDITDDGYITGLY